MWNRPDQELEPDDTVEFPAVTDPDDGWQALGSDPDDPPGWLVHGERAADGWVEITIIPLADGALEGGDAAPDQTALRAAKGERQARGCPGRSTATSPGPPPTTPGSTTPLRKTPRP